MQNNSLLYICYCGCHSLFNNNVFLPMLQFLSSHFRAYIQALEKLQLDIATSSDLIGVEARGGTSLFSTRREPMKNRSSVFALGDRINILKVCLIYIYWSFLFILSGVWLWCCCLMHIYSAVCLFLNFACCRTMIKVSLYCLFVNLVAIYDRSINC